MGFLPFQNRIFQKHDYFLQNYMTPMSLGRDFIKSSDLGARASSCLCTCEAARLKIDVEDPN